MVFSSTIFLFLFLPAVLGLYLVIPKSLRNLLLLVSSLFFYAWGEKFLVWILIASTLVDYVCGLIISGGLFGGKIRMLEPNVPRTPVQKFGLVLSLCSNLAFLGYFKYLNFGLDTYNALAGAALAWKDFARVTLPIGISFFTFQSMSYTIDVYRGQVQATRNVVDFACFVTMFPQLVAGPIVRYRDIAGQLVERVVRREDFAEGVRRFTIGLGKKMLIANTLAVPADRIFALSTGLLTPAAAWLGVVCYTFQIYFDFSGYSDMAIGLGRMFGFRYLENFDFPYISQSVKEFWRRWHISLSTWFRDYLYIPLGGSRGGRTRVYFNLVVVFFLCGLWHGASWTFVIWGLYHGVFLVVERLGLEGWLRGRWRVARHVYTLLVVMVGWVLFRSDTFTQATAYLAAMAGFAKGSGALHPVSVYLNPEVVLVLVAAAIGSMPWLPALSRWRRRLWAPEAGRAARVLDDALTVASLAALVLVLVGCGMALSAGTYNPFIYFRF